MNPTDSETTLLAEAFFFARDRGRTAFRELNLDSSPDILLVVFGRNNEHLSLEYVFPTYGKRLNQNLVDRLAQDPFEFELLHSAQRPAKDAAKTEAERLTEVLADVFIHQVGQDSIPLPSRPYRLGHFLASIVFLVEPAIIRAVVTSQGQQRAPVDSLFFEVVLELCEQTAHALTLGANPLVESLVHGADSFDIVRRAAKQFFWKTLFTAGFQKGLPGLFHTCEEISSATYEKKQPNARIALLAPDNKNIIYKYRLKTPLLMSHTRGARKLLETADESTYLISDSEYIHGVASLAPGFTDFITIEFPSHATWRVTQNGMLLMQIVRGKPHLPRMLLKADNFFHGLPRTIRNMTTEAANNLYSAASICAAEGKGTTLVVHEDATSELDRLMPQALRIEPQLLTPDLLRSLMQIDGAVICDAQGVCHGFGVILDGMARGSGDSSRGSRFNSALRYTQAHPHSAAIVISDDGIADFLPTPPPLAPQATVEQKLHLLERYCSQEPPPPVPIQQLFRWFEQRTHALEPKLLQRLQELRSDLEEKAGADWQKEAMIFIHD